MFTIWNFVKTTKLLYKKTILLLNRLYIVTKKDLTIVHYRYFKLLNSNENTIVTAPTSAGKTILFQFGITRVLRNLAFSESHGIPFKIVYSMLYTLYHKRNGLFSDNLFKIKYLNNNSCSNNDLV